MRALLATLLAFALLAPAAHGAAHLPPAGKVWHGVASGADVGDFSARTGRRPAVWQHWIQWGGDFGWAFRRSSEAGARTMLHLSTAAGQHQPGRLTPGEIARGDGDAYLRRLNAAIAAHGEPVYLRLMAEMNNCDLAYSSHDCNGRRRGADHAPGRFKQAWRRTALVLRGGPGVDARLRALRMPPVRGSGELPRAKVALLWSPMTGGSPMIAALRPGVFWPGARYVDWVSTSFYSRYPNFHWLEPYYRSFAVRYRKPFAFGEWAMWGADSGAFVKRLFGWVRAHPRVRLMVYNQGHDPGGPFRLRRHPAAQRALHAELRAPRFGGS